MIARPKASFNPGPWAALVTLALVTAVPSMAGPASADVSQPAPAAEQAGAPGTAETAAAVDGTGLDAIGVAGLWVFIDPVTGKISATPTAEQLDRVRSFQGSVNKSGDGLVPFELEGGGRGLHLAGRFRHALEVSRQPDGSFALTCSDHPGELPARTPPTPEVAVK